MTEHVYLKSQTLFYSYGIRALCDSQSPQVSNIFKQNGIFLFNWGKWINGKYGKVIEPSNQLAPFPRWNRYRIQRVGKFYPNPILNIAPILVHPLFFLMLSGVFSLKFLKIFWDLKSFIPCRLLNTSYISSDIKI